MKRSLSFVVLLLFSVLLLSPSLAQTSISGDITGNVTDPTGAAVGGATVVATSTANGQVKKATANASGEYRVPLLSPGVYKVTVTAPSFDTSTLLVTVSAGTIAQADAKLQIGANSTTVEVTSAEPLLHTDDAQLSTTFSLEQVQTLPNPGNDLTFIAQTAPGSVMNTQGGYGNFSSFGLPATSNTFTVNGGYENDPFLNVNNSGATNLLLGNNDIATVSVISPAYSATFGGLAGAQVAEISRSGSNSFHGNLAYFWNGSVMNANDWFNDNSGTKKPRSNANQWAAAIGGPIKRDKAFFFINTEGIRVIIPVRGTLEGPSAAWQNYILGSAGTDPTFAPYGNLAANGTQSQAPLYQTLFNYFNDAPGASSAIPDPGGDPRFVQFNSTSSNFAQEWIITGRVDYNFTDKDHVFVHYKQDKGLQPTSTSLINPIFNANSPQPQYEGQMGYTRSISPSITNQFLVTGSYYRAIFTNTNQAAATASVPFVFIPEDGAWAQNGSYIGGIDYALPQGRNVTGYQFQDDLSISRGKHNLSFGYSIRRDDVTDYTPSEHQVGEAVTLDSGEFAAGYTDEWLQRFPTRTTEPLSTYNMGLYVQDQWKVAPNFSITAGLRIEHNSTPVCHENCFSNFSADFASLPTASTALYSSIFAGNRKRAFLHQQPVGLDPRIGFNYQPDSKTTIRAGFGIFTDTFPAQIASSLDSNPPNVARFTILGAAFGDNTTFDPNRADSASAAAASSNAAFKANYYTPNGNYASLSTLTGGAFRRPTIVGTTPHVKIPTTEEYSFGFERQLSTSTVLSATYVGNHSYHGAVLNPNLNAYGTISGLPAARPNNSLGTTEIYNSNNQSNYNGVVASLNHRSKVGTVQFNYTYSKALDLVSNGGFDGFGVNPVGQEDPYDLSKNYGLADYNVKHYVSASYVVTIPTYRGPKALVADWQVSGTVFHSSGLPFTVTDAGTVPTYYGGTLFADQLDNNFNHTCAGASHAGDTGVPCDFATFDTSGNFNHFASASGFGTQSRNQFTGPGYTDADIAVLKGFHLGWRESELKVGVQFFNVFNHPNFAQPLADVSDGSGALGLITATVNTPTSILGSFLGGDASPRLIQLKGTFSF